MQPALYPAPSTPWAECVAHFVRHMMGKSAGSAEIYYQILVRFLRLHPDPAAVVRRDIENFINLPCEKGPRLGQPPKMATRNNRISVLSSFYQFAMSFTPTGWDETIFQKRNPCAGIYYGKSERLHRSLDEEELARLFAVIPTNTVQGLRDRAYFLTALLTTRRRSEILRLRWGDISAGLITGEGGKTHLGYMYEFTSKGNGPQRFKTELPGLAYHAIVRYLRAAGRLDTMQPGDAIFVPVGPKQGGGNRAPDNEPLGGQTMNTNLKRYAVMAGLDPKRICLHSFRHTAIQQRLKAGEQPLSIMRITGHRSMNSFYQYCYRLVGEADPGASAIEQKFSFLAK